MMRSIKVLILVNLFAVALFAISGCNLEDGNFTVTFDEGRRLHEGCRIYLAGVDIGEVASVKPLNTGVAVQIDVEEEFRSQLTTASVFYIDTSGSQPSLLVMNTKKGASELNPGQTVEGTDSLLVWKSMDVARSYNSYKDTDAGKRFSTEVESVQKEVAELVESTDWDKVGEDAEIIFNGLSEDFDKALEDPDVQLAMQMLDEKIVQAQEALSKVGDSEELRQLNASLVRAYDKLVEEWGKAEK